MQVGAIGYGSPVFAVRSGAVRPVPALANVLNTARQDEVNISPAGKAAQMIEALNKQKTNVIEQRNQLISDTLESGRSIKDIEAQLEGFDEKLNNLETSIADIQAQQMEQAVKDSVQKADKPQAGGAPQTLEEAEAEQTRAMTQMATGLDNARTQLSTSRQLEADANILKRQINADRSTTRIENPAPGDNAASREYLSAKAEKLGGINARARAAYQKSGATLGEVHARQQAYATAAENVADARDAAETEEEPAYTPLDRTA